MKRRLEQLINGKFEYMHPTIEVSRETVREIVKKGRNFQGELSVRASDGRKLRGYVSSSHRRILVNRDRFSGEESVIAFGVDMSGLEPGEIVEGSLTLITSIGEKEIPFYVEAEKEQVRSSVGEITSMEEFVTLARTSFREAFHIFKNPEAFSYVLKKEDRKSSALYLGIVRNPVTYQHLEEYLIGIGAKEQVCLSLREDTAEYYEIQESIQEQVELRRTGWGYLEIEVEVQGDFLSVAKKTIREDEFIGSVCRLNYVILKNALGRGRKYGYIRLRTPYQELLYTVVASRDKKIQIQEGLAEKRCRAEFMKDYMALRTHKLDYKSWVSHTTSLLDNLKSTGRDYAQYQLYEAYVLYQEEKNEEAVEILKRFKGRSFAKRDLEAAGAYVYLCHCTGLSGDSYQTARKLRSLYLQKEDSFLLFWLWSQMEDEFQTSPQKKLFALEEQYERGCRSPLLYLEAWNVIAEDITFLRRVGGLWTQVFLYAGKEGLLTEEISMRIAYLSGYEKHFSGSLFQALTAAYEAFPSDDGLEAVCKYIMKGNPRNPRFFRWFALAVEQGLRITRLYEYYMETVDISYQRELPRTLLLYFAYNNRSLGDDRKAYLFANIVLNKERTPKVYEDYLDSMKKFTVQMLEKEKINEDYAVLYQEFAMKPETMEEGKRIGRMLFTYRVYCDDPKVRNIVVRHPQMSREEVYPCIRGIAYPRIYTEDGVVLFQDSRQRRYAATIDYNRKKLFDETDVVERCLRLGVAQPGLLLYECERQELSSDSLDFFGILSGLPDFSKDYRRKIRKELLTYYASHIGEEQTEKALRDMDYNAFASVDRKGLLELLIASGFYEAAYEVIEEWGCEHVEPETLLKMTSRLILKKEMEEDEGLVALANQIYEQRKYDEVLLIYLMKFKKGDVSLLLKLWRSVRSFHLDTFQLEERILETLMFTWDYRPEGGEIFQSYVHQTGKESVILAYLTFVSYGEFVHGIHQGNLLEKCLETACERHWEMDIICRLNYLKRLSEKQGLTKKEENLAREILSECEKRELCFSFFARLPLEILNVCQLEDKLCAEYQGSPQSRVVLHYALDAGFGTQAEWKSEPVRNMYEGFFVKPFTLFYGESLRYYFTVEDKGNKHKTPENVIIMDKIQEENRSRFQVLNRILYNWRSAQIQEARDLLENYLGRERYLKHIYTIEKEP